MGRVQDRVAVDDLRMSHRQVQATVPPQSWPTTIADAAPSERMSSRTSSASLSAA
jgi:hypothetical protein